MAKKFAHIIRIPRSLNINEGSPGKMRGIFHIVNAKSSNRWYNSRKKKEYEELLHLILDSLLI